MAPRKPLKQESTEKFKEAKSEPKTKQQPLFECLFSASSRGAVPAGEATEQAAAEPVGRRICFEEDTGFEEVTPESRRTPALRSAEAKPAAASAAPQPTVTAAKSAPKKRVRTDIDQAAWLTADRLKYNRFYYRTMFSFDSGTQGAGATFFIKVVQGRSPLLYPK